MSEPVRRIITNQIMVVPEADKLIDDAMRIIQNELVKFAKMSKETKTLSLAEARVLQGYVKSLTELSKESRERAKADDPSQMSDEQLVEAMQTLLKKSPKTASSVAPEDTEDGE